MTLSDIDKRYQKIISDVSDGLVKEALDDLHVLIALAQQPDFRALFEKYSEIYKNILKYTVEGIQDPDRPKIYDKLLSSVYELADMVYQHLLTRQSGMKIYQIKKEFESKREWLSDPDGGHIEIQTIFNLIWLADRLQEKDIDLIRHVRQSDRFPWYEKCVVISALTLSLIRCFDQNKIDLLITFYEDGEDQLWHRALVGLIIGLFLYDDRLKLYPSIRNRLTLLKDRDGLDREIQMALIQFLRSRETERITKKLQEEILPEVVKLAPRLEEKLDLDSLISKDPQDEKNPDWEDFFKDTPDLYQKMEEFTALQMEGSDVFWSAFAMLKHFDFFRPAHHWFLPFHPDNREVRTIFEEVFSEKDPESFLDGIARSAFLCNSDKYSFCLNIRFLPEIQKSLLLNFFAVELKNLNEITDEDAMLNKATKDKFIFTQYIQDLYRFHKLHPLKNEFLDIFSVEPQIHRAWFIAFLLDDLTVIKNIAEFYFEKDHFDQAREIYQLLNKKGDQSYEVFEKIGYCFQRKGRYEDALDFYLKAELFDTNKVWLYKKIALCYRNLKNYDDAIWYYQELLKLIPDNTGILASIGYCYLDKNEPEQALNYFYKVEFLTSEDIVSMRPVAWIHFVQGNFDAAQVYYQKIVSKGPNKYDFMNLGHVEWCLGNRKAAVSHYRSSIREKDNSLELFLAGFTADRHFLIDHGIPAQDIPLMLDYLKYSLDTAG